MRAKTWLRNWGLLLAMACSASCADEVGSPAPHAHDTPIEEQEPGQDTQALTRRADPLSAVGHGGFFDAKGVEIEPDSRFIRNAQLYYLERLRASADTQAAAQFERKQARIKRIVDDEVLANSFLITWFTNQSNTSEGAAIAAKNAALRGHYLRTYQPDRKEKDPLGLTPAQRERLTGEGAIPLSLTTNGGKEYLEECLNAGVPTPPDWGSADWSGPNPLIKKFIVTGLAADVYTFESKSPRGICMALPRYNPDSRTIALLGVICLGADTSKACFWDNEDVPRSGITPIEDFRGGAQLAGGDICSDCHAGENPYVVHPGSAVDIGAIQHPNSWYDPLVIASWPQNPGPTNVLDPIVLAGGDGSCLSCHQYGSAGRFPEASTALPGWCNAVFRNAVGLGSATKTMPLGGGSLDFSKHINGLDAACGDPPSEGVDVPSDGIKNDPGFLSPPIVVAPLYGCATKIVVRGTVMHSKVDVMIDGVLVNSVETLNPNETIVDVPALVPGQKVTAVQRNGMGTSAPSDPVEVRDHKVDFPMGLPAPTIDPKLIYECGRMIAVHALPGSNVTVYTNNTDPRTYVSAGEWTNLPPGKIPFDFADEFTAEYEICGDSSPRSSPPEVAVAAPPTVPAPKLEPPQTYAGQELVTMSNLLNGALSELSVAGFGQVAQFSTAVSWMPDIYVAGALGRPLQSGDVLQGMQVLCEKGPPTDLPPTTSCKELPPPRIRHPHIGDTIVIVTDSIPGANVRITTSLGEELGDGSGVLIALKRPLTTSDVLLVVQQVGECTSSQAYRVNVRNAQG